ncbi:cupin domain-containing protein [uncultured Desulfovibrio sp.]|uniref:cupin domain-containing protein n=2 Tax=uncultured Desulfovibrio sp. TaxID=167968 RepID=UPI0026037FC5|nr:cupin domain-containing protein [uncultured Desulfovibrio sp.]
MTHCKLAHINLNAGRSELHDLLELTGAEVSCNTLPAGVSVPFVHAHTRNEEIYLVLNGRGFLFIDGEERPLEQGDCFRIDPQGQRCLRAADDSELRFICIQARAESLEGFTMTDGIVSQSDRKPSWL